MSLTMPLVLLLSSLTAPAAVPLASAAPAWGAADSVQTQNERLRAVMQPSSGVNGFFVREVRGSVLAGFNSTRVFEPASSIKVLAHLYAMRRVESGSLKLRDRIGVYTSNNNDVQCNGQPTESIAAALKLMMEQSDNDRTRAVVEYLGRANLNTMASNLGFGKVRWTRPMECEVADQDLSIENEMTLVDAGRLYASVVTGESLREEASRRQFWELMAGHTHGTTIDQELETAGLSATARTSYKARVRGGSKGGWWPNKGRTSHIGWVRLPWCVDGHVEQRDYVHGFFVDDGHKVESNSGPVYGMLGIMQKEIMREQIRSSVRSWQSCANASPSYDAADAPRAGVQQTPDFTPM